MFASGIFIDDDLISGSPAWGFVDISDVDGNISLSMKGWGAIVGNFDAESNALMLFVVKLGVIFNFEFTISGDFKDT